jgi:hypothetical protein
VIKLHDQVFWRKFKELRELERKKKALRDMGPIPDMHLRGFETINYISFRRPVGEKTLEIIKSAMVTHSIKGVVDNKRIRFKDAQFNGKFLRDISRAITFKDIVMTVRMRS